MTQGRGPQHQILPQQSVREEKMNSISQIKDVEGRLQTKEDRDVVIIDHIQNPFSIPTVNNDMDFIGAMDRKVTNDMNDQLLSDSNDEEARLAIQQMHLTKSPGPDGMAPLFYEKYWDTVGDVTKAILPSSLHGYIFGFLKSHSYYSHS